MVACRLAPGFSKQYEVPRSIRVGNVSPRRHPYRLIAIAIGAVLLCGLGVALAMGDASSNRGGSETYSWRTRHVERLVRFEDKARVVNCSRLPNATNAHRWHCLVGPSGRQGTIDVKIWRNASITTHAVGVPAFVVGR